MKKAFVAFVLAFNLMLVGCSQRQEQPSSINISLTSQEVTILKASYGNPFEGRCTRTGWWDHCAFDTDWVQTVRQDARNGNNVTILVWGHLSYPKEVYGGDYARLQGINPGDAQGLELDYFSEVQCSALLDGKTTDAKDYPANFDATNKNKLFFPVFSLIWADPTKQHSLKVCCGGKNKETNGIHVSEYCETLNLAPITN